MRLTEAGFVGLATAALTLAAEQSGGRLVAILEGGYDQPALGRSVAAVLTTFDEAP
jgi:acetoin utilization deacetylase AcuC-like enzyme